MGEKIKMDEEKYVLELSKSIKKMTDRDLLEFISATLVLTEYDKSIKKELLELAKAYTINKK